MTAQALSTMVQHGRNPVIVVISNGIYGYEQFLVDASYFNGATSARPYVILNQWDFVAFAQGLGLQFAQAVNTSASLDAALTGARAASGPALIVAQVDPHGLPAELS
jgi:indolepyruvate decarboxylase